MLGAAIRNNTQWCEAVCRAHRTGGNWSSAIWQTDRSPPRFYPDLITLSPDENEEQLVALERLAAGRPAWSAKDSHASLDLTHLGARKLFDAEWQIASGASSSTPCDVVVVHTEPGLAQWEKSWGDNPTAPRIFLSSLLNDPRAIFLAHMQGENCVGGAALYIAHGVCGVTNIFGDPEILINAAHQRASGLPLICYASQHIANFTSLGPLRVWIAEENDA